MRRIGIYGGAFNPPHFGHSRAAEYVISALELDKLLLIPSSTSHHKPLPPGSPTPAQRLEMVSLWAGEKMEASDIELSRGGTSYTYQTVAALKQQYPQDELILCMGTDMFLSFHSWKEPEQILQNASLAVFYRGDRGEIADIDARRKEYEAHVRGTSVAAQAPLGIRERGRPFCDGNGDRSGGNTRRQRLYL